MNKDALIASLQKTNEAQARQLEIQSVQLEMQSVQLEKLSQQIEQLLRVLYGKKSEKSRPKDTRMTSEPLIHHSTQKTKKKVLRASNRTRLPDHIERIDVIHDIKAGEKQCPHCHQPRHSIGERASEQLDFVPAKLIVRRHRCLKYACRCGQGGVVQAPLPNQPIDKGIPGPGLLADIIVSKYQDHLPLYRQRLRFHRQGMDISDSTMGGWIREVAFMLRPIKMALKEELLRARKIHTDDTPIPVMAKGKTKKARLWTYLTDQRVSYPICVYDYTPTRHSKGPVQFLKNYQGYLQADAFSGYDVLYEKHAITEVGCMAHCRRKFFDVAEAAKGESKANDILKLIGELYGIEKHIKHWCNKDRYFYRKKYAKPILYKMHRTINKYYQRATAGTPFYKALQYAINHWRALCRFLADGCLCIDNNAAERSIKSVVIGRKNWLFAGSHTGGEWAATIYSIIETCKLNGINTNEYLTDVLQRLPDTLQKDLPTLLPYHWQKAA